MKKIIITIIVTISCLALFSQLANYKRAYHWYFGDSAGLDFTSGIPVTVSGSLYSHEGCASMSDMNGNLLFYTNGGGRDTGCSWWMNSQKPKVMGAIWNSNHEIMENGAMLGHEGGGWSAIQSSIIIPKPGSSTEYYLFTMTEDEFYDGGTGNGICDTTQYAQGGLDYFVIDMSYNGGLGKVTQFNVNLLPDISSEALDATVHANGTDYWLITMDESNQFILFRISSTGISAPIYTGIASGSRPIKISPDASLILARNVLYDFDNSTGAITNARDLGTLLGPAFSPNSRYIYGCDFLLNVFQYDAQAGTGSAADIINSKVQVGTMNGGTSYYTKQIGPDGKIYIPKFQTKHLAVIHCPNTPGADCNFEDDAVSFATDTVMLGLPNFIDAWFVSDDSCGIPGLPVTLTRFSGYNQNTANILEWETAAEFNNDYFVVQRAGESRNYRNTGTVKGAGNSNTNLKYTFTDLNPPAGVNYYRLKQVDFDGNLEYSEEIVVVNTENENEELTISGLYPNPAGNELKIIIHTAKNLDKFRFSIHDMYGRELISNYEKLYSGENIIHIDLEYISAGIYYLSINDSEYSFLRRIVKD